MRLALTLLLGVHGLVHLLGFVKAFGLAEVAALATPISRAAGALWLLAGLGFLASAIGLSVAPTRWWIVGLPTWLLSQTLIALAWPDAKFGTIPNVIVLVPLALAILDARPNSFRSTYEHESATLLASLPATAPLVSEACLAPLPPLVQTFLRRAGVVGRPHVRGFRAKFHGRFRQGPDGRWMPFTSDQHNVVNPSARLFLMRASLFGIPMDAYHDFVLAEARFRVRVLSLFTVVDGRGPMLNQSETVTIFNDLGVLAPAALVDAPVRWTTIDDRSVRGEFTRGDQTVAAVLTFDAQGDLVGFVSEDRFHSVDGRTGQQTPWSTPLRDHRDFGGVRLPGRGDATWMTPESDFAYGEFTLDAIEYIPVGAKP